MRWWEQCYTSLGAIKGYQNAVEQHLVPLGRPPKPQIEEQQGLEEAEDNFKGIFEKKSQTNIKEEMENK